MNNKIVAIVVAILIVAGLGWWLMNKKSGTDTTNQNTNQTQSASGSTDQAKPESGVENTSLAALMASGSKKCTNSDANGSGTFYVGNNKSRGDFSSVAGGQTTQGHMIFDGDTSYVWTEGQAQGIKMKASEMSKNQASQQTVDPNVKMNYNCSSWSVDSAVFIPPTNVQFLDLGAMMNR